VGGQASVSYRDVQTTKTDRLEGKSSFGPTTRHGGTSFGYPKDLLQSRLAVRSVSHEARPEDAPDVRSAVERQNPFKPLTGSADAASRRYGRHHLSPALVILASLGAVLLG